MKFLGSKVYKFILFHYFMIATFWSCNKRMSIIRKIFHKKIPFRINERGFRILKKKKQELKKWIKNSQCIFND